MIYVNIIVVATAAIKERTFFLRLIFWHMLHLRPPPRLGSMASRCIPACNISVLLLL